MSRKRTLLLGLALGCVAAGVAWRQAARVSAANAAAGSLSRVVTTTQRIEEFAPLETEALLVQEVGRENVPMGAVHSLEEVKDCVTARALEAGEILRDEDLLSVETLGLAAELPPGKRAMTVEVDRVANVGGVLKPGRFVDVVATFEEGRVAKTVLQRMQVLAVFRRRARQVEGEETEGKEPGDMLVTLAVTPVEANRLALADEAGELRLALRPLRDTEWDGLFATEATTLPDLLGDAAAKLERQPPSGSPIPQPKAKAEASPPPAVRTPKAPSSSPSSRRAVRSVPPPDFGVLPAPVLPAPTAATVPPPPSPSSPSLPRPLPPSAPAATPRATPSPPPEPWRVTVIRGTEVETVAVAP